MVQVELARADEFGKSDRTFITHTHLGEFINFNDTVLCYDLNKTTAEVTKTSEVVGIPVTHSVVPITTAETTTSNVVATNKTTKRTTNSLSLVE
jgi:hypothetical protein